MLGKLPHSSQKTMSLKIYSPHHHIMRDQKKRVGQIIVDNKCIAAFSLGWREKNIMHWALMEVFFANSTQWITPLFIC